jgi:hypothetical protein
MKTLSTIRNVLIGIRPLFSWSTAAVLLLGAVQPRPATAAQVKNFCESGSAVSSQFGALGAVWSQMWGEAPWPWFDCDASPNVGFLDENVVGQQTTKTTGPADIDANLVLHLPFKGTITLTAWDDENPLQVAGKIAGTMTGSFVADLNAAHAVTNELTITIKFGQSVHSAPDALIQVTETSGKFQSIDAVGNWQWHVSGTITIARVPSLPPQLNIFAALSNSALLLGAEEDVVLSGSYVRSVP